MPLPIARKIVTEEERLLTIQAAKDDNDSMHFPTHMITKGDQIVGGWCLGGIPLVMVWHDRTAVNVKESMILNNTIYTVMNDRSPNGFFIACNDDSPYINHMAKFGYNPIWPTNMFFKQRK